MHFAKLAKAILAPAFLSFGRIRHVAPAGALLVGLALLRFRKVTASIAAVAC